MHCRNHSEVTEGVQLCSGCRRPFCVDCVVGIESRPHCAACKHERLLDVRSGVDSFALRFAGVWQRFGAALLDGLLVNIPMYVAMFLLMKDGEDGPWTSFIGVPFMFLYFIYEGLMTQFKDGQTLGRMAVKARIVRPDGSSISGKQAWGRAALRMILGCLSIIDYLPFFFTKDRTTLHDMMARTRVVDVG